MIKLPAARKADLNACPAHGPGRIDTPVHAKGLVLIGGLPAARRTDRIQCSGGVYEKITEGSPSVLIGGLEAARKGDASTHGGVIATGFGRVLIGGFAPCASSKETIERAMNQIRTSDFAKTEEGKKVLAKLEELHGNGMIQHQELEPGVAARVHGGDAILITGNVQDHLEISNQYAHDPDRTASELVHEGTHFVANEEAGKHGNTIDDEMRTHNNQLDFYQEQRRSGCEPDGALDAKEKARQNGDLRSDLRNAYYPNLPEHNDPWEP